MKIFEQEQPTEQEELQIKVEQIKKMLISQKQSLANTRNRVLATIFTDRNHTAQEILDVFGTDAKELVEVQGAIDQLLSGLDSSYEPMNLDVEYTVNEDGTITVTKEFVFPENISPRIEE